MPRADFAIFETTSSPAGLTEATAAVSGSNASPGSSTCLTIESDTTPAAGAGRGWLYFDGAFNAGDASSDIYVDRASSGMMPMFFARVPLHINPNLDFDTFDGYTAELDSDGSGSVRIRSWSAGTPTTLATSSPSAYSPMNGTWERWRFTVKDSGADCDLRIQKWNGSAWTTVLSHTDVGSAFNGATGAFGFGVIDRAGGSSWPGPVIRFDDWRCDEVLT